MSSLVIHADAVDGPRVGADSYLIGIAGPACAGKSAVATALHMRLSGSCTVIHQGSFMHDHENLPRTGRWANVMHPNAISWGEFTTALRQLSSGRAAQVPIYDHTGRRRVQLRPTTPTLFTIVEGLNLYHSAVVQQLFYLRFALTIEEPNKPRRRNRRSKPGDAEYWEQVVVPTQKDFILPGLERATHHFDAQAPVAQTAYQMHTIIRAVRDIDERRESALR